MLKKEWKNLFKNKFLIVALIAIITIPTIYTTLFLDNSGTTLFSFPAGTNIADAKITIPYDKTEIVLNDPDNEQAEISGKTFIHGFGGYHYINSENFAISNAVNGIEDITGEVTVAVPRFSNYDADNKEWVDFDENNIITGEGVLLK